MASLTYLGHASFQIKTDSKKSSMSIRFLENIS